MDVKHRLGGSVGKYARASKILGMQPKSNAEMLMIGMTGKAFQIH